uniref:Hybrid PKS-NRPS synthetase xenE n=1 Tax=Xenoacremonium sinensis TaxID=2480843 RepID=XENE_XENSI|nr:RecName: Full=Hybrid PKS-NRPS synthetase xenE; AltName: Full=Xenoacremones biosynthesis cluster protein E [Xenoacremonium sp. BF-2018a]QOJ72663.1 XenE [Xenoacremonium sp. BF-2018a]
MSGQDPVKESGQREPIAVVGSGFRFPGSSNNPSKLWDLLVKPRDLLTKIPENRFNSDAFYHPKPFHHGTSDVRESYFLEEDHRQFDAAFFNIKPVEVHAIDPQQRILMEAVYESLEAAGLSMESLAGSRTGVYVGLMCADYVDLLNNDVNSLPTYTPTGTARSIMSNRISYFFDWHGPSMTIDTACSSSLVAVHQAVQLLRSGDSDVAVAAGANLMLGPLPYIAESKLQMLSSNSRSRMWDIDASGYARGEGVAAVVLKRLSSAIADGDQIECIIRESGINQDGRTKGITMPSSVAQADLISRTYAKAGLNPRDPTERCQYFEAHGTGTAAGDPKEAEAISKAFFHPGEDISGKTDPLYVGSIKTVIGHTEGTAGLAGLLKASLAVQHGIVPPNLLFNQLSPAVEPFYTNLEVLTSPRPWPKLAEGTPRRASINSFGFGGTNAHCIIENYIPSPAHTDRAITTRQFTPFNFSAASEKSLRGILTDYSNYLRLNPEVSLQDLSYTLYARRSEHAVRVHISAGSTTDLYTRIDDLLQVPSSGGNAQSIGTRSKILSRPVRALGVFTGQGAQWPSMGRELVLNSPYAKEVVQKLDLVLQSLPEPERPDWSLMYELTCDASQSRLNTAVIAQPLCTVVQIILFDLLSSAGVKLQAVVGHSSGEIAAAYAAGYLTREDALKIAYYRGYFTNLTPSDRPGAMMAIGTSAEDAEELCSLPMFQGRLAVAAVNSSSSVTISGDRDAIEQAKEVLEDEKKFARLLKVDKAYHSSHMVPCAEGYLEALKNSEIHPLSGTDDCVWHSSTHKNKYSHGDGALAGQYWADNMIQPVLFSHAVEAAASAGDAFDIAIEVGPHPALKGPALQTLQEVQKDTIPYTGLLNRGKDDIEALSDALGYLWTQFTPSLIDFRGFDLLASGGEQRSLIRNLPTYHWDHDKIFWHKSRAVKAFLGQKNIPNPLLGSRTTDVMEQEIRWRNLLRLSELPWVRGHQLQGQVIYPATAYISTAVEAARFLVPKGDNIALIEVEDFSLGKPLVFAEDAAGIETVFTLSDIAKENDTTYSASFIYHASTNAETEQLSTHAIGRVIVITGETSSHWLPSRQKDLPNLVDIPEDRFYASLEPLGYAYSGYFKTMSSIKRRLNFSSTKIRVPPQDDEPEKMLLHPALLDTALQGIFLAYCWPGDGSLEQLHVPTGIKNFRVNVGLCQQVLTPETDVSSCTQLTGNPLATKHLNGDVEIYADDGAGLVQMEGLRVVAFAEQTEDADRAIFSEHVWDVLAPNCERAMGGKRATLQDYEFAYGMERVVVYYMKQLVTLFPESLRKIMNLEWHFECMFAFFTDVLTTLEAGERRTARREWLQDTAADVEGIKARYAHTVDMQLTCAVGDNLPAVLRGESTILQHLTKDNLLNRFYEVGLGLKEVSGYLGKIVEQVVHRHPRMKILEIGKSGTGGATKVIMRGIGRSFSSYTYTDISPNFFESAQEVFSAVADKMIFKTLDVEKDITEQSFEEHSYDLVVASLVLHATTNLKRTLTNARRLLKPGGYLIFQEICDNDIARVGFLICAVPGWWLGQDDGRKLSPCVSTSEWHNLLLETGFSGADSPMPEYDAAPYPLAVIVSQAVDDRIALLREPLSLVQNDASVGEPWDLVLVGGQTSKTAMIIEQISGLITSSGVTHSVFKTIDEVDGTRISPTTAILCLADLDEPVFKGLSSTTLEGLQRLFETQRTVLWITQGCRSEDPWMNMSVGLGRTLVLENPDLALQFLDLEPGVEPNPRQLLEVLLRLRQSDIWEKEGKFDDVLWTNEHELAYDKGDLTLSRVHLSGALNDRYNAAKRTVLEAKNPQETPLNLSLGPSLKQFLVLDDVLVAKTLSSWELKDDSETLIKVTHSLLMPALAAPTPLYLILGTINKTKKSVLSIADNNGSYALVASNKVLAIDVPAGQESQLLSLFNTRLQVDSMLSLCESDSTLLIHEPSPDLASAIAACGSSGKINVVFTTSTSSGDSTWTRIDAYSTQRAIRSLLPENVSVFIDCSAGSQSRRTASLIASCLLPSCFQTTISGVQSLQRIRGLSPTDLCQKLNDALAWASKELAAPSNPGTLPSIKLETLIDDSAVASTTQAVVDWSTATSVPVQVSTVDNHVTFKGNNTYVLFGLTSDLAQSICDWMVSRGARNIVLTSRNPKIDSNWIELLKGAGVRLEAFANDITNKDALSSLVHHIRKNFPPIAGVAHGAMVLDDVSFFEMPYEKMTKVLGPKVQGAILLDEIFQDTSLDFFVFFSSVTAIAGNRGQSAYTSANMFMTSLASQRRDKGLAASILHLGAVMGVGYINRGFSDAFFTTLRRAGFMMMSERGLHLLFGEAVLASNPHSGRNPEVITALELSRLGDKPPLWTKFPRFQHCLQADDGANKRAKKKTAAVSTKLKLAEATTAEEILEIVQDAFYLKLQVALQIPDETDKSQVLASGTDDLGIDSLVAVEIRSWFLKELETEIPVFKVLSGGSVTQLVEYAIGSMPAELTPNRADSAKASEPEPEAPATLMPPPDSVSSSPSSLPKTSASGSSQQMSEGSSKTSEQGDAQDKKEESPSESVNDISELTYEKVLPVSPGQSRFWFLKHLLEDQTTANNTIWVSIQGTIRLNDLEMAIRKVAARHEALRTSFFMDENQKPIQAISETSRLYLEKKTLSSGSQAEREFEGLKKHVYDIEHGECMRLVYLEVTDTESYLLIGSHHIIMDGISLEVFLKDIEKAYNGQSLSNQVYQYSDYSEKLRQELEQGTMQEEINYWKSEFADVPSPLPLLPFAAEKQRKSLAAYSHTSVSRLVDPRVARQISNTCHKLKANVFHFYLGVFEVLLFKLFGNNDVCIGMADANRWNEKVSQSIGMYLNLLPLRFHLDGRQSFEAMLKDTRRKAYLAMSNSRLPFDVLLDNVICERSSAFSPLFQAFINYRQGVNEKRVLGNATGATKELSLPRAGYDISLDIIENPGNDTRVTVMLQKALYSDNESSRVLDLYFKLLNDLSSSSKKMLEEVSLFTEQEISNSIQLGQGPVLPSQWPETLVHRIDAMIAVHTDKVALKEITGKSWTYLQLEEEINRVSSVLIQANVTSGSTVAIYQEASPNFVFSLLAVLRIGAIYVPLDCNLPEGRLRLVLAECKPSALLADGKTLSQIGSLGLSPSVTILDVSRLPAASASISPVFTKAANPAAILFTSGSTGVPKGVVLSHGSLRNHVEALVHTHGFGSETVLQQSSVGFDMSMNQVFMALANGGSLVIVPESLRKDSSAIAKILLEQNITYTSATPSEYFAWLRHGSDDLLRNKSWKYATAGGEKFTPKLLQAFQKLKSAFSHSFHAFNAYGPTECSMSSNELEVNLDGHSAQFITAGRALPNYAVYIVDENATPQTIEIPGEICIAGAGVALEYLNNPVETAKKFLKDPFASVSAIERGWNRMYRTGDKGVLRPDGTLEILGRIEGDTQIKLRGLRIEMQDIEQSILKAGEGRVKEAIVTPRGDPTILVAHAVVSPIVSIDNEREYLRGLAASLPLPQYMRPAAIIPIATMPLNASGKIDRRALQNLDIPSTLQQKTRSKRKLTDTESKLAQIWVEVLPQQLQEVYAIDETSDFFQVGGNSMLLIELRELVKKRFQVHLPLLRFFEHSTLGAMAAAIQDTSPGEKLEINWDVETEVPSAYSELNTQEPAQSHSSHKTIVLTGATGFLGKYLLNLLTEAPDVDKIHCIAIRNREKLANFTNSAKVVIHDGDLASPRCGLSEADATSVFGSANVIIHNGADVSFLKTYSSLRASNVLSTKELVKLALPHHIPIHYISTATVGKLNKSDSLAPESLAQYPPGPSFVDGYAASKWASEVFLEKTTRQFGLPTFIHRPSSITGDGAGENDIVPSVLKYSAMIKALPDSSKWTGYIDLITVEKAAAGIADSVLQGRLVNVTATEAEYLHHAGEKVIPAQSIKTILTADDGPQWESVSMKNWVEKAIQNGMNPLVGEFLLSIDKGQGMQIGQKLLSKTDGSKNEF